MSCCFVSVVPIRNKQTIFHGHTRNQFNVLLFHGHARDPFTIFSLERPNPACHGAFLTTNEQAVATHFFLNTSAHVIIDNALLCQSQVQ